MNTTAIQNLRTARFHLGTWLSIGSPVIAELAGQCGFDWLLLDLEHGCGGEASLFQNLQALRGTSSAIIVRVGAPHPDLIQRVLDWGADGIMVPHIESAEAAQAVVQATRFPPRGTRGYSRSVRACNYGLGQPDASIDPLIFAQIESERGVAQVRSIAAVDGIDVLFVGPADLAFDLNAQASTKTYASCLSEVVAAARAATRFCGILCRDEATLPQLREAGFSHQALDSDLAILRTGYQHLVKSYGTRYHDAH